MKQTNAKPGNGETGTKKYKSKVDANKISQRVADEVSAQNNQTPQQEKTQQNNNKTQQNKKKKKRNPFFLAVKILFAMGLVAAAAAFSVVFFIYYSVYRTSDSITYLDIKPNQYVTTIYEGDKVLDKLHGEENREYASIDEMPEYLIDAVIAIEDKRFFTHSGVDIKSVARAVVINIQNKSFVEGASTITQQLVKNNLLKDDSLTLERKVEEQCAAYKLEKELENKFGSKNGAKRYIMEQYLNTVNLAHGLNGVKTAATHYFGKPLQELTLSESAVIAAIIKNPTRFSPVNSPENNLGRANIILAYMWEQELIHLSEYDEAREDINSGALYERVRRPEDFEQDAASSTHSYFVDQVIIDVARDLMYEKGMSEAAAYNLIYSGGLSIYTTLDSQIQQIVDNAYADSSLFPAVTGMQVYLTFHTQDGVIRNDTFCTSEEEASAFLNQAREMVLGDGKIIEEESMQKIVQPQSSFALIDFKTGEVKAIAGGRGGKEYNLAFNRATQAKRHPGSCFKVLAAYAPALDTGVIQANSILVDEPYTVRGYTPKNYDFRYRGQTSVRVAIRDSINVLAVKTLEQTGYDIAFDYLERFGFTTLVDYEERSGRIYTDKVPSLALGGLTDGVTMLELAAAYGTFANNGRYNKPVFYTTVIGHDGNVLLNNQVTPEQVISEKTAYILTDMMKDVITSGTGTQARFSSLKMPVAGKTGTATNDLDLAFAGYTPYYVGAVWVGYDIPRELNYTQNYHLLLWRSIMEQVHTVKELPVIDFERPEGLADSELGRSRVGGNAQPVRPVTPAQETPVEEQEAEAGAAEPTNTGEDNGVQLPESGAESFFPVETPIIPEQSETPPQDTTPPQSETPQQPPPETPAPPQDPVPQPQTPDPAPVPAPDVLGPPTID